MATRGRPPKPAEEKRRAGNPGKRALPEPVAVVPALVDEPAAPEQLGDIGREAWARIWRHAQGWLAPSDLTLLELVCSALDERAALQRAVAALGPVVASPNGHPMANPALTELRKLDAQLTSWLAACGLTPSDRSRLGLVEVKVASKLDDLKNRRRSQGSA